MTSPAAYNAAKPSAISQPSTASYVPTTFANEKPAGNPLIAPGTKQPVAITIPTQHGKAPMNGHPPITPAVPTVAPTQIVTNVKSDSNANGTINSRSRNGSVTIKTPGGPNTFHSHDVTMAGKPNMPQFGFSDSPVVGHSTPQMGSSAPIAIPAVGNNNAVPSPANSPQPIPLTSGGTNPGLQHGGQKPVFGSHRNDEGERQMRQNIGQPPMNNQHPHGRKDSHHSMHDQAMPPQNSRGGYQGNRGGPSRPYYGQNAPYMNNNYSGSGRGGAPNNRPMGSPFARHSMPFNNQSPRMAPGSAAPSTMPPGSPAMGNVSAASPAMGQAVPYSPHQPYPGGPPSNYGPGMPPNQYPPPYMGAPGYGPPMPGYSQYSVGQPMGYQGQPQPAYQPQPFNPATSNFTPAGAQGMSRQNSAMSHTDRPGSSGPPPPTSLAMNGPVIASGTHLTSSSIQQAPAPVVSGVSSSSSSTFTRPKKSTIVIRNDQGEPVDLNRLRGSPNPTAAQAHQPVTPSHPPAQVPSPALTAKSAEIPTEASHFVKSTEERKKEFAEAIAAKAKQEAEAKSMSEAEVETKSKQEAEEKFKQEADAKAKAKAEEKVKVEAEAKAKAEEQAKFKEEAAAATKAKEAEKAAAAAPRTKPTLAEFDARGFENLSADEQELYFDLMEAADAEREAAQAEITIKKKAEEEVAKAKADQDRAKNAAEEDQKLKEQEAEAERLELEKERKQKEREARGEEVDINSVLKATIDDLRAVPVSQKKEASAEQISTSSSLGGVANKMAGLSLGKTSSAIKPGSQRQKPAALNLQPLKTSVVEAPQPSAALQSLKSARFLSVMSQDIYPEGIKSPNPAVSSAARGKSLPFKYDLNFMLQFKPACKEPPSIDFQHQVKTLIGEESGSRSASVKTPAGSSRQNSRVGQGGFPGAFGAGVPMPVGRSLPPGTSSAERFGMANPVGRPNTMGGFSRGGTFPGGVAISRNPSNTNMVPNSPRTGSRRGNQSKRNDPHQGKHEAKANAAMPLTQGMDLKPIATTSTGWKPMSIAKKQVASGGNDGLMDPETVQRKVKAALNKMTPEKFDRLSDQILEIASQSKHEKDGRTLRQVIQLVFEKATDESHWSAMYARLSRRMLDTMDPGIQDEGITDKNGKIVAGGALFRKYLLNRCQEEFERGWSGEIPKGKEESDNKDNKDGKKEAELLSDEYYIAAAIKRRGLGLIQFIGELYKLNMLTERIMHECVRKLLDYEGDPDEAEIESLCKLLKTVGKTLDSTEKSHPVMDAYFQRIISLMDTDNIPSRIRFMLMDVVDMRKSRWDTADVNKGPKTLDEIKAETEALNAQKALEAARSNQRQGGRPQAGRGDARNFSQGYGQAASNQVGLEDLRRLKGSANRSSSHNITLGPTSMLQSRSNSGRRLGPGGSLSRGNDDGSSSSRTGTPIQRQSSNTNAFALLAAHHSEDPTSPPSAGASPNIAAATPASADSRRPT